MTGIKVVRRDSARDAHIVAEITALVQQQDIVGATLMARNALDAGTIHPMLLNLRAAWHGEQGRSADALSDLRIAMAIDPRDVFVRNALGILLGRLGKWDEALSILQETVVLAPDFAPAYFSLGWVNEFTGELVLARQNFEKATALEPGFAAAFGHLASLAYRRADWAATEDLASRALAIDPSQAIALPALAGVALARRDLDDAERRLALLGDFSHLPETEAALAETMLGDLRDAQGRHPEAFAAYRRRNRAKFRQAASQYDTPGRTATDYVHWLIRYHSRAASVPSQHPEAKPDSRDGAIGHVFLVGFPRSGTTLLENVLASHPAMCALDERDTLGEAARNFLADDAGLAQWSAITPAQIEEQRRIYWDRVRKFGAVVAGKVFVDKYPLSSIKLALVAKLFPDAKILFALRDPRDVVWSCFRRAFALNSSMFELLDLERGARFYAAVMQLSELYRETLGLSWYQIRYERLVADFEGEMRAVSDFIGLPWDDRMRDFAEHAKARTIKTPSSTQVLRGLYQGAGQWQPYATELKPALEIVEPWVRRFGYAES